jgi:hypothetical protein
MTALMLLGYCALIVKALVAVVVVSLALWLTARVLE